MAPKKSTKKEVLEQPGTMPDGEHNYYVGGWSYCQSIEDISTLAHDLNARRTAALEAATAEEEAKMRQAGVERVNVLVLPTQLRGGQAGAEGGAVELVVVDRMHIEGVPHRVLDAAASNIKCWASDAAATIVDEPTRPTTAGADEEAAVVAGDDNKDAMPEVTVAAATTAEPGRTASGAVSDSDEQQRRRSTSPGAHPPRYGCSSAATAAGEAQVDGAICVTGVRPHIFVRPSLPTTAATQPASGAATPQRRASRTSSASGTRGRPSSQRRNKTKLTPEQLVEQERQRAEAEALLQRQTEEAITAARAEEAHLRTFAHPDRWASVELCNMTFTGPVTVRQAHVTFQNCRFCGAAAGDVPQLTITQYCQVTCVACSFEAPLCCSVYALPASRLQLRRCLFSGVTASELARLKFTLPSSGEREDDDVADEAAGHAGVAPETTAAGLTSEVLLQARQSALVTPLTAGQREVYAMVAQARPYAAAVQVDAAQLHMDDCCCLFLSTAVVFSGRWGEAAASKTNSHHGSAVSHQTSSSVQKCYFIHLYGSGIVVHKSGSGLAVQQNIFADCDYYAVDCDHTARNVVLRGNSFAADAVLRLRDGAKAVALHNVMHSIAVDENRHENLCLEPVY